MLAELIPHEPLEGVRMEGKVVTPDPSFGDIVLGHHEALTEHEHAEEAGAKCHADDVVRLCRSDRVHEGLGHDQREQQVRQEVAEAVEVRHQDHQECRDHSDHRQPRQARQKVGQDVRQTRDLAVGTLPSEGVALLQEKRQDCDRHEHEEGLHIEEEREQRIRGCTHLLGHLILTGDCALLPVHGPHHERQRDVHREADCKYVGVLHVHHQRAVQEDKELHDGACCLGGQGGRAGVRQAVALVGIREEPLGNVRTPVLFHKLVHLFLFHSEVRVHNVQEELGWVAVLRAHSAVLGKIVDRSLAGGAKVDLLPARHEVDEVK
mmetsp:Transcript_56248/g.174453  ORF Transcript_56248/g.174453 Transcript_56248/m.174453 type:complete len:321 (-) Transcript_56248:803-1765(-)